MLSGTDVTTPVFLELFLTMFDSRLSGETNFELNFQLWDFLVLSLISGKTESESLLYVLEMATVTDDGSTANLGGDLNPGAIGLPTSSMTSMVSPGVTPAVPGGPPSHHECQENFVGVSFKR